MTDIVERLREYIVLVGHIVGGNGRPFTTVYNFDGMRFKERSKAIAYGLSECGSDDFNIGVVEDTKLISLDWMNEVVDTDAAELSEIAAQIGMTRSDRALQGKKATDAK